MSWQTYVDDHLMCDIDGTGHHLSDAAIIGHDGSVWAQSSSFPQARNNFLFILFAHSTPVPFIDLPIIIIQPCLETISM